MSTAVDVALADFAAGYSLGYESGYSTGFAHGVTEEGAAWASILTGCTDAWRQPRHDAVVRAREVDHAPCPMRCKRCSRCIASLAWWSRGGRPYAGAEQEAALARGEVA